MLAKQYKAMTRGDCEATARQFYTGNASVLRRHLLAVGGFDSAFRRAEDVEMAYRLDGSWSHFAFEPAAIGLHYAARSFDSWRSPATPTDATTSSSPATAAGGTSTVAPRRLPKTALCRCGRCSACVFPDGGWRRSGRRTASASPSWARDRPLSITRFSIEWDLHVAYCQGVAVELGRPRVLWSSSDTITGRTVAQ